MSHRQFRIAKGVEKKLTDSCQLYHSPKKQILDCADIPPIKTDFRGVNTSSPKQILERVNLPPMKTDFKRADGSVNRSVLHPSPKTDFRRVNTRKSSPTCSKSTRGTALTK